MLRNKKVFETKLILRTPDLMGGNKWGFVAYGEVNDRYVFKSFEAKIEDESFLSKVNSCEIKNLHAGVLIHCILGRDRFGEPLLKNVIGEPTAMADEALLENVCKYLEEED